MSFIEGISLFIIPVGCVPPACWPYLPACTAQGGVSAHGGCLLPGGCLLLVGGSAPRGVSAIPACTEADPPSVNRMNDRQV